jgi:hypothetical protein
MEILVAIAKHLFWVKICSVVPRGPVAIKIGEIFRVPRDIFGKIGLKILVIAPSIKPTYRLSLRDTHPLKMRSTPLPCRNYTSKILLMILGDPLTHLQSLISSCIIHNEFFQYRFLDCILAIVLEVEVAIISELPTFGSFFLTHRVCILAIPFRYRLSHDCTRSPIMDS